MEVKEKCWGMEKMNFNAWRDRDWFLVYTDRRLQWWVDKHPDCKTCEALRRGDTKALKEFGIKICGEIRSIM